MVNIIAHRGWWKTPEEQNTLVAFARAFDAGIGVELDVRDCGGMLVVSHDPPKGSVCLYKVRTTLRPDESMPFAAVLDLLGDRPNILAVNVKSCGLAPLFSAIKKKPQNWFFFDMAHADEVEYKAHQLPIYHFWGFESPIFVLSPELYGVPHLEMWDRIVETDKVVTLLTDNVEEAMEFFK